jgi:uncharacterized protein (DUF1800 family)
MGLAPAELRERAAQPYERSVEQLFDAARKFEPLHTEHRTVTSEVHRKLKPPEQAMLRSEGRAATKRLGETWRQRMITTDGCLREKVALFWHGHFAAWSHWSLNTERYLNMLREHALGNFRTLLKEVSRSASMIEFLNNNRNRKGAPNENFAREVMELFTLGRGHYSEQDIHEAARAFTGWSFELDTAAFQFREEHHDGGEKTFRGRTGNFSGDDVLDMLLDDPRTARFICEKIYRWFVSPELDEPFVADMARRFFASDYDIGDLLRHVFLSDHFRQPARFGMRIKSPVELLGGLDKCFRIRFEREESATFLQRSLGQVLLYPPNVAGWKEGQAWIDSNSLMLRLKLPAALLNQGALDWDGPGAGAIDNDMVPGATMADAPMREEKNRILRTTLEKDAFLAQLPADVSNEDLFQLMLQVAPAEAMRNGMSQGQRWERVLEVLSSPEYQLC